MKPKTAIKFLVEAFLILEFFTLSLGLNIQIDQSIDASYGFGSTAILTYMGIPNGIFLQQSMAYKVFGYVTKDLYLYGELGVQSVDTLVLRYTPLDLRFGTVQVKGLGFSPIAVIGMSSKNISFGKVQGSLKRTVFVVKDPYQPFLLGPIAYQSVYIYVNGRLIPSNQYEIDYGNGKIFIFNLIYADIVTIEYQSMNEPSPYYVLTAARTEKLENYSLEESALTIFSTPANQYFLCSKIADGNDDQNFSLVGYLNIDSTASFKVEAIKRFSLFNSQCSLEAYLVTKGFRQPMGIAENENVGFSIFNKNSYGKVSFSSNLNGLNFSLEASKTHFEVQVGKDPNLVMKFSNGSSYLGLNFGSGGIQSVQSFQDGPFSLKLHQHFEDGGKELEAQINVSTPITFEASVSNSSIGWRISRTFGKFNTEIDWEKESTQTCEKITATLSDTSMFAFSPLTWTADFQTGQSTSLLYLSANLDSPFGEINLFGSVEAIHELLIRSLSMNYSNEFGGTSCSIALRYESDITKFSANVNRKVFDWNMEMGISMGISNSKFGGALRVKVWRDDF